MSSQNAEQNLGNPASDETPDAAARNRQEALYGIRSLDYDTLEGLVARASEVHLDLCDMIVDSFRRVEQARLPAQSPFDDLINSVWQSIHGRRFGEETGPLEIFVLAEEVASEIMDIIKSIPVICEEHGNPEIRLQALWALRKIGNMILWASPNELGLQVRGHFDGNSVLERSMLAVIDEMTPGEKLAICDGQDDHGGDASLLSKIEELKEEGRWCLLYDNMHWVIEALQDTSLPDGSSHDDEN
ncbi:hypothetical protein F1880_002234 [Penicillium rolfsii]|nr:hypothetical protein F1880_002234 [Penicillium rolfsii]